MADKVEKVKKRKRQIDGSSKPSKRVAIEDDQQIKFSVRETGKWAPIIASTPGLAVPNSINLKPYTKDRRNPTRPGFSGDIATKELLLHSSEHPKLDYTAREEEAGGSDALLKHYVGVYDPETGKMEVVQARKMVVRGSVRAHQATVQDEVSTNMRELRNALGQTFGTKKARKAIASVTENAISPDKSARALANGGKAPKLDSAAVAVLSSMAEATNGMTSREELAMRADDAKPRPKADKDAKDIKDVYTTESLIGVETMKLVPVKQWQDTIKAKKEVVVTSRYVANRIEKAGTNVEKLKILRYMLLMLDFYNASRPARGGRQLPRRDDLKRILGDMPEAAVEGLKRKFADGGMVTKFGVDLLITHLCAMSCLVDNYEVDMWDLKDDLKLETKQMAQYYMEIGAKITGLGEAERKRQNLERAAAAQHKVAKLKLPLDFPKVSFGRRK